MSRTRSMLALLVLVPAIASAQAPAAKTVVGGGSSNLSNGIRVGDMLYVSGQLGMNRQNPDTTIQGQTKLALEATKRIVELGGSTMANVVKCTVFLTRVTDFQGMNQAYREFFPSEPPTRSTIVVAALVVPNALVEVECMAAIPKAP